MDLLFSFYITWPSQLITFLASITYNQGAVVTNDNPQPSKLVSRGEYFIRHDHDRPCSLPWWDRSNQCPFNRSLPSLRTVALITSKSRLLTQKPFSLFTGRGYAHPCFSGPLTSRVKLLDFSISPFQFFGKLGSGAQATKSAQTILRQ